MLDILTVVMAFFTIISVGLILYLLIYRPLRSLGDPTSPVAHSSDDAVRQLILLQQHHSHHASGSSYSPGYESTTDSATHRQHEASAGCEVTSSSDWSASSGSDFSSSSFDCSSSSFDSSSSTSGSSD